MVRDIPLRVIIGLFIILLACNSLLDAQTGRRLWILQAPDAIVEYNPATFGQINVQKVPPQALKDPGNFSVNGKGQMLFVPTMHDASADEGGGSGADRIWLWDGRKAALVDRNARYSRTAAGSNRIAVEAAPQCFLSADGKQLYWFENEFTKLMEGIGLDISVSTAFHFWQTDLNGGRRQLLLESAFPSCDCGTGVCSETCPEAEVWAPEDGIDDFIFVTYWIPGQIGSDYVSSFVSRKTSAHWSLDKMPEPIIQVMDAANGGAVVIEAIPDSGCCGWDNESNDQTIVRRSGKKVVLFDERRRYANADYDISFFTSNAKLSPDLHSVAMTIVASSPAGKDLRVSSEGKPDTAELERILKASSELPAVEVLKLSDSPTRTSFVPHATMVDWISDHEILLIENHMLVAFDPATNARRRSGIKALQPSHVIIR